MNVIYLQTARLLTQVAPVVLQSGTFALKGGTAINLFIREVPRLSVDIDLLLPDHTLTREQALEKTNAALEESAARLRKLGFATRAIATAEATQTKLFARRGNIEIKAEVNTVLRGVVGVVTQRPLSDRAQDLLQAEVAVPVASIEDVYGGKLVAALDRQHPRDLFDVLQLYEHGEMTPSIRHAFVIYLASHHRPLHEVLAPKLRDINLDYEGAFRGMTVDAVELDRLLEVRTRLIRDIQQCLNDRERRFLISLVHAEPEWQLLDVSHAQELPALKWKLQNLQQLQRKNPKKFIEQAATLKTLLGG